MGPLARIFGGGVIGAAAGLLEAAAKVGESWARVREGFRTGTDDKLIALRRDMNDLRAAADRMRRALSIR